MIPGVDHVGIAVRSIAEARRFWETLGLSVERIEEVESEGVRVAMILCGATQIELLEPTREDSPIARFLERRGPGIHHLCLSSDDVVGDDARLRTAGFEVLRPEPTLGAGGCWVQFVHPRSTGGVLVELSQPPAESATPVAGDRREEGASKGAVSTSAHGDAGRGKAL